LVWQYDEAAAVAELELDAPTGFREHGLALENVIAGQQRAWLAPRIQRVGDPGNVGSLSDLLSSGHQSSSVRHLSRKNAYTSLGAIQPAEGLRWGGHVGYRHYRNQESPRCRI
jgi:hypothetical protein